jgi:hypothetical protein
MQIISIQVKGDKYGNITRPENNEPNYIVVFLIYTLGYQILDYKRVYALNRKSGHEQPLTTYIKHAGTVDDNLLFWSASRFYLLGCRPPFNK